MKPYELTTLILTIIFGLIAAWLYQTLGELGKLLSLLCILPPGISYIVGFMGSGDTHPIK